MNRITVEVTYYTPSGVLIDPPIFGTGDVVNIVATFSEPVGRPQFLANIPSTQDPPTYQSFPRQGHTGFSKVWVASNVKTLTIAGVTPESSSVRTLDIMPLYVESGPCPTPGCSDRILLFCNQIYTCIKGGTYMMTTVKDVQPHDLPSGYICPGTPNWPCLFIEHSKWINADDDSEVYPPFKNGDKVKLEITFNKDVDVPTLFNAPQYKVYYRRSRAVATDRKNVWIIPNSDDGNDPYITVNEVINAPDGQKVASDGFICVSVQPYNFLNTNNSSDDVPNVPFKQSDGEFNDNLCAPVRNNPAAKVTYNASSYTPGDSVVITVTFESDLPTIIPHIATSGMEEIPVFVPLTKVTPTVYKYTHVVKTAGLYEVQLSSEPGKYTCNPGPGGIGYDGVLLAITEGRTFNVIANHPPSPGPMPHPGPQPHLDHVSCKKCPIPGYGSVIHPQTRVPYLQSLNQPGNLLTRGMIISRDVRVSVGRRGGSKLQFGNCRQTNCKKKPPSTSLALGDCNVALNKMGAWFGALGGSRNPPRNSF